MTEIPSAPVVVPLPPAHLAPEASVPPAPVSPVLPAPVESHQGTRVELGFRDGSSAELDPDSAQAKALENIASALTRRD
ncbi:MAG TPA: hypothetical protein VNA30_06890 [Mycobacteriales bacterium]|nr:hypothetical protein [Mycobacteriales bacterium]